MLHDVQADQFPREICKRSLDAAKNSLLVIEKLDQQLKIEMKKKLTMKAKDLEKRQQDLALRRVRAYINIGKPGVGLRVNLTFSRFQPMP